MNSVFVRRVTLPPHINGLVCEDADGNYNIYISDNLPDSRNVTVLLHELRHCSEGHLHDETANIETKETIANG